MPNELDGIATEGAAIESELSTAPGAQLDQAPEAAQAATDAQEAQEWAQLPKLFGGILAHALPELKDVYTDDACLKWGQGMLPVAHKYGWSPSAALGLWGPLALATFGLAGPTFKAIQKRRAAVAAAGKKPVTVQNAEAVQVPPQT